MRNKFNIKRCSGKLLLATLAMVAGLANAHVGGACNPLTVEPFTDYPPVYPHETTTFKVLGKRWSTSGQLKDYFDQQRRLLKDIQAQQIPADAQSSLKLASVGDVMRMSYNQDDWVQPALKEYLDTVDILNGNLETLISPNHPLPPSSIFMMNSAPSVVTGFRNQAGQNYFSLMSLANNHTFDYPDDAIRDTLSLLREEGVFQSGVREKKTEKPYLVVEKNGIRIGYYAVTAFVNREKMLRDSEFHFNPIVDGMKAVPFYEWKDSCEIDLSDTANILKRMERDGADIKIISIHWGVEHDMYPQPVQLDVAHRIVQQGADIIVGAHPHVPQPAEICFVNGYEEQLGQSLAQRQKEQGCVIESSDGKPRKAMIYYSLGNLTSYSPFFWQQVGVIAELQLVKRQGNKQSQVDWFAPEFVLTYDEAKHPPHGSRSINLLNTYIARRCGGDGCSGATLDMVSMLNRHLTGQSLSWWEELMIIATSTYDSLKNIIYWKFLAPQGDHPVPGDSSG